MFRKLALCSFVLLLSGAAATAVAADLTLDQILAKNIQARGGMEKLKAVKSMRMTGKMTVGPGMEAPITLIEKRPHNMRLEFSLQGMTGVQAYDGKSGWTIMPFQGKKDAEPMAEDDLKDAEEQADFDGPLVDYKEKGNKVELMGKDAVEGGEAYKLKVTLKNGDVRYIYIDPDSFLEIKTEGKRTIRGADQEVESTIGDYKEVEGLMIPFSMQAGMKGSPQKQSITIDKVEINPTVDDSVFKMPAAAPAPAADKKPGA
ncbi:MAG: outer membrane lipoprotein-sorting protein [Acidobacteria bacterium]|nr:outer membrane lipoprotein-sorting protein [Acidobacteriota bacterium]